MPNATTDDDVGRGAADSPTEPPTPRAAPESEGRDHHERQRNDDNHGGLRLGRHQRIFPFAWCRSRQSEATAASQWREPAEHLPLFERLVQLLAGTENPDTAQKTRVRAALGGIPTALLYAAPNDDPAAVRDAALAAACGALGVPLQRRRSATREALSERCGLSARESPASLGG